MEIQEFNAMVARNIRFFREERGWSTAELAKRTGNVVKSFIIKIEHNAVEPVHKKKIDQSHIQNIALALGIKPEVITEEDETINSQILEFQSMPETIGSNFDTQFEVFKKYEDLACRLLLKCAFRGPTEQAKILYHSAKLDYIRGDLERSVKQTLHALEIANYINDKNIILSARHQLANCYYSLGKFDLADEMIEQFPPLTEDEYFIRRAKITFLKGLMDARKQKWETAENNFKLSILTAKTDKTLRVLEGRCYQALGGMYKDIGKLLEAIDVSKISVGISTEVNDELNIIYALKTLGEIYDCLGDRKNALRYFDESLERAKAIESFRRIDALRLQFCIAKCRSDLESLKEISSWIQDEDFSDNEIASMFIDIARSHKELSEDKKAHEYYEKAIQILQR